MSTASANPTTTSPWAVDLETYCCPDCSGSLLSAADSLTCGGCGKNYPIREGVLIVKDRIESNNQVAQEFYDSPLWPKFRFWERLTWVCNGGEKRARNQVLKHLPQKAGLKLLDVAVGDGVYLPWMPKDWDITGIDVTWSQLRDCLPRTRGRSVRLIQGEAESLPLRDAQFDAVLSIGAFNYFNDPEGSLREMVRVCRPGATIVVSDELPNLTDRMIGHKLGMPAIDRWIVSKLMHLGDDFTDMVERLSKFNVREVASQVLPNFEYHEVWHGVGYVLVGRVPE